MNYNRNFLGQPIAEGDEVAYIRGLRTGISAGIKCKCIGKIASIKKGRAYIKCSYAESCYRDVSEAGAIHDVDCNDIICKITDGVTFWWRTTVEG